MINPQKVKPYLLEQQDVVLSNSKKIRIEKTKKERLFEGFKDVDSAGIQIASIIADNPLLTQFMFLESEPSYSLGTGGISTSFPMILDPHYDYNERCKRIDYQEQNKKLDDKHLKSQNDNYSLYQTFLKEWVEALSEDERLIKLMDRRDMTFEKLKEELDAITDNNPKLGKLQSDNLQILSRYSYEAQTLGKLKRFIKSINNAEKNSRSLNSDFLKLPQQKEQISTALSKLAKLVDFSIDSICLDCWYEKDQLPFASSITNTNVIQINERCLNCNGTGLIHKLNMSFPRSLNSLLLLDSSWLYEIIIGYAVSKLDRVKQVFVHKKIQVYENGLVCKGVEVDVTVITNDGKLYLIEVTKQGDTSHIMENISKKIANFEEAKIPFEKIMYVTADNKDMYFDIPKKARIFQIKHLPVLLKFMEEWMDS